MDLIEKWKYRMIAVRISDRIGEYAENALPGEGYIDFDAMTEIFKSVHPDIPFLVEVTMKNSKYQDVHEFLQIAYDAAARLDRNTKD